LFIIIGEKLNMFIDVTKICNKLGSECVTIYGEYLQELFIVYRQLDKKNITGLTFICDQNTLPPSVNTIDINRKLDNNRKTDDKLRRLVMIKQ
jgi:hypothetical protein